MNYLAEIKAFYDWLECNPLEATHISLWHGLMAIANKTGWKSEFTVPMSMLEFKTGIKRSNLYKARNKLQQSGLITFKERDGRQSAVYKLLPLCANSVHNSNEEAANKDLDLLLRPCDGHNGNTRVTNEQQTSDTTVTNEYSIPKPKLNSNETKTKQAEKTASSLSAETADGIIKKWNSLNLSQLIKIDGKRKEMLNARIKDYGADKIIQAIENVKKSSFLRGQGKNNWTITFDWLIKPNNFTKVLEGNYADKSGGATKSDGIDYDLLAKQDELKRKYTAEAEQNANNANAESGVADW